MGRILAWSVITLLLVWWIARSCGLTPEQVQDQILLAQINAEEGEAYRALNALRPGVITLVSGLQLEVLAAGDGDIPGSEDWVQVHFLGTHIDGREFENSWRRGEPATIAIARTIPGWQAALESMPVGTRVRLVVPPELAYGRAGGGIIGPEETLVFEIELLAIVPADSPVPPEEWEKPVPGLR